MDSGRAEDPVTECPERWSVSGMTCTACAARLERVVERLPGVGGARVDFATGLLTVEGSPDERVVRDAIAGAGFDARALADRAAAPDGRAELIRVAVAAAFGMQSMMVGLMLASDGTPEDLVKPLGVLAGALSAPAVLWAGARLLRATFHALRARSIGVDGLVGLGVALTWVASWLAVADGRSHVWFDTAAMLVALHLGGRVIEARVRRRATGVVQSLMSLAPSRAIREIGGGVEEIDAAALRHGDRVHVLPGARIPVDGLVVTGRSAVDRALLTGEPLPISVEPGALVEAGALNGEGALVIEAVATPGERRIDRIAAAVEEAVSKRPATLRAADRVASVIVPIVGLLAAGAGAWHLTRGESLSDALVAAAAVIVVTCPCALTLAAPVAVATAAGAAAERGIVFRDADALERLATATAIWFDKTGTLTSGALTVGHMLLAPGARAAVVLERAGALAAASQHPASRAIGRERPSTIPAAGARVVPGDGVEAAIDGATWRLGRAGWASAEPPGDETSVDLGRDGQHVARFLLADAVVPDARATIDELRALGLGARVLSGDRAGAVREVADAVGVREADGGMSPEGKAEALAAAARAGQRVAFVGDGMNEAVAHAAAAVGIAPAGSTDVAASAAGVLMLRDGLHSLPVAVRLARATRAVIRQNLAWALAYNALAVPLVALGYASPLLAAAAMTASSLTVTLNAARLLRFGGASPPAPAAIRALQEFS